MHVQFLPLHISSTGLKLTPDTPPPSVETGLALNTCGSLASGLTPLSAGFFLALQAQATTCLENAALLKLGISEVHVRIT